MNKGFKALPEYVQRKIDPQMAKKYMGGGAVMQRPMFRQAGGPMAAQPQPPMAPPPQPPMAPPQPSSMEMASAAAQQTGQQAGEIASAQIMANIDQADDSKSLIDALRGNEKPLEARYAELAGYVGEADAQQTPESVLAMVQPTIMLTEEGAVDSGIGELMQGLAGMIDMETPSGEPTPMGQGVGELMMQGAGNTPPVNFNKGGEVRRYAPGGEVAANAAAYMPEFQKLYASVLGDPADREAELEEQKKLTKAQMLFDIAQTALAAGAPMDRAMSPAERLMTAAQSTQLFPRIGERAAAQLAAKQAQDKERRSMDLAALQSSLTQASTDKAAEDALALAAAKKSEETIKGVPVSVFNKLSKKDQDRILLGESNSVNGVPRDIFNNLSVDDKKLILGTSTEPTEVKGIPYSIFKTLSQEDQKRVVVGDPKGVNGVPRDIYDTLDADAQASVIGTAKGPVKGVPYSVYENLSADEQKRLVLGDPQGIKGIPESIFNTLDPDVQTRILGGEEGPVRGIPAKIFNALPKAQQTRVILGDPQGVNGIPRDIYNSLPEEDKKAILGTAPADVKGVPRDIYNTLTPSAQEAILGINVDIKGIPENIYNELSEDDQKKVLGIAPVVPDSYSSKVIDTADGPTLVVMNDRTGQEVSAKTYDPVASGALIKFSITNDDGSLTETVELLGSKAGKELQAKVNAANQAKPGSANMMKVGTESVNPQAYLTKEGQVITSFDNRTFTDSAGNVKLLTDVEARSLGEANVYEIIKSQNIQNYAKERVAQRQKQLGNITFVDENGDPLDAELQTQLRNFMSTTLQELSISEQDVRKGTGLASNAMAVLNAVGGTFFPETANAIFKNNAQARKNLELFNFVAVSAMARNPRMAVYDMQQVKGNLINPKNLIANTATEADKFQAQIALMTQERNMLEDAIARGDKAVMDDVSSALSKIREIDFVLSLVRINPDRRQGSLTEALSATDEFE